MVEQNLFGEVLTKNEKKKNSFNIIEKIEANIKLRNQNTFNKRKGEKIIENAIYKLDNHYVLCGDSEDEDLLKIFINDIKIDGIVTDPPYGISYKSPSGSGLTKRGDYDIIIGDEKEFNPLLLIKHELPTIMFGANHFANKLPNSAGWLVWDKREGEAINNNSDCELAWTNILNSARLFHHKWNGMIKASEKDDKRIHPTQKPIKLMMWCMNICKVGENVLDPYLGSGSTLIACDYTNRNCYGIEKDKSFLGASLEHMSLKTNKFYEFYKQL